MGMKSISGVLKEEVEINFRVVRGRGVKISSN